MKAESLSTGNNRTWIIGLLGLVWLSPLYAAERVALVIGNDRYQRIAGLHHAGRDARAVAAKLRAAPLKFSVIEGYDLDEAGMLDTLDRFRQALSAEGSVGLFYYAGHGAQISRGAGAEIGAENLLMPVDVSVSTQSQLVASSLRLSQVLAAMSEGGRAINVVLLDACRNNPAQNARGTRGLAPVASQSGFLIQFATAANQTADDGPADGNGAYTGVLLDWLDRPDLSLGDVFTEVAGEVRRRTGQEPWMSSTLGQRVFLAGKSTLQRPVEGLPADQGELRIEVSPAQAQLRMDGVLLGSGTRTVREPAGKTVLIRAEAEGHEPAEDRVRVQGGQVADVRLRLARLAAASAPQAEPAAITASTPTAAGERFRDCPSCPEMVVIPAGRFQQGSPSDEDDRAGDEGPVRTVQVLSFALGMREVTRGEFGRFVEATSYQTEAERNVGANEGCYAYKGGTDFGWKAGTSWRDPGFAQADDHPVVCVSWKDAKAYVEWLSLESGKTYRLPSESELEYANRAGTTTPWPWGNSGELGCTHANYGDAWAKSYFSDFPAASCIDGQVYTAPVGSYQANDFGLYDMAGNAWEWSEDCWHDNYTEAPIDGSAWVSGGDCVLRVLRGGSWLYYPVGLRSAYRTRATQTDRNFSFGFRLARTF